MNYYPEIRQPLKHELWRTLPINDLLSLCRTNKEFNDICKHNNTWIYLIQRDFGTSYNGPNAHLVYKKYRELLNRFTQLFPIITLPALELIYTFNSKSQELWDKLNEKYILIRERIPELPKTYILNFDRTYRSLVDLLNDDEHKRWMNYYFGHLNTLLPDFDATVNLINSLDKDQAVDYIMSLGKGNDIVFVNKQLKEIPIRLDDLMIIDNRLYSLVSFDILSIILNYVRNYESELVKLLNV